MEEAGIKVGFSMHPRWLGEGDLRQFVEPLRRAGLAALEFELDAHLDLWPEFAPLMAQAVELGLDLSFHAPYRAPYSLVGFAGAACERIAAEYRPMLAIADAWGRRMGSRRVVVIHAAVSKTPAARDDLVADTRAFLSWGLESFPNLTLALENNAPEKPGETKVGASPEAVLAVLEGLESERLTVCWDLGHDYRSRGAEAPAPGWLRRVGHAHVHDVDERGEDHFPLIYGRVPVRAWLGALRETLGQGIAVLELKGGHLRGWPPERIQAVLIQSITSINQDVSR